MHDLSLFIADGQTLPRAGIRAILSEYFSFNPEAEEFVNKEELLNRLMTKQPDILILDLDLSEIKTIQDLAGFTRSFPKLRVLFITDAQTHDKIHQILDCGITNCILKSCERQELIDAVNATTSNRKYFCNGILSVLPERKKTTRRYPPDHERITPAEQEIVRFIAEGLTSKEIASRKNLSYHTIVTHRKNIFRKLGINNSIELMLYAMHSGLIEVIDYSI